MKQEKTKNYMSLGMCFGVPVGGIIGLIFMSNFVLGMCIGLVLGMVVGMMFKVKE